MAAIFSNIYIENNATNYPLTQKLLERFSSCNQIYIQHYKDVFNRKNQNWRLQKQNQNLILAVRDNNFIYHGSNNCCSFNNKNFYYNSMVLNCLYDCSYCYLQVLYPSANLVVFVNSSDYLNHTAKILEKNKQMYLCISYDSDLLALESILGFNQQWLNFMQNYPALIIESRTKSANFNSLKNIALNKNFILAWSLNPEEIINKYERYTPPLSARIKAINAAIQNGWRVRLCIDPIIYLKNWQDIYKNFIASLDKMLPLLKVTDFSIGNFRMSRDFLKKIKSSGVSNDLIYFPFSDTNNTCTYPNELGNQMTKLISDHLLSIKIPEEKIFIY